MVMLEKGLSEAMNARIIGSGEEVVILAHGFGGDQSVWDKILPSLAKRYRILIFDWSFSGAVKDPNFYDPVKYSSYDAFADDLIALLEEMNLTSTTSSLVFIGHSMSGMIGCIASIKRPELFDRLILIGASPSYLNIEDYKGGFDSSQLDQILFNIESNYDNWAQHFATLVVDAKDPDSVDKFQKCLKRMKPEVVVPLSKVVFHCNEHDTLEKVTTPCTIIQPSNDIVAPISVAEYMHKKIKAKSTVEIIDADGHFPQLTAHIQLLDVLGGVLNL